jgi:4-amino-4-deoxychorismate lyase
MSLLIESIKLVDGKFCNLFYHEQRMLRAWNEIFGIDEDFNLEGFLNALEVPSKGLFKVRILYDDLTKQVEFLPYKPKEIKTLKVIEDDRISYDYKYADRKKIDKLFSQRGDCDDILIVKKGNVTDSSFSNIAFKRGKFWYTPWSALLKGTMRQNLINNNKIIEEQIELGDIHAFKKFKLVNAMLEFDSPEIDVSNIVL